MSTNLHSIGNAFIPASVGVWSRLRGEREEVCDALLADAHNGRNVIGESSDESSRLVEWHHRELLHARLRQLDDALDRLMAGSYGHCSECGKLIDEKRRDADPAVSLCLGCQRMIEDEHHFSKL